MHAIPGLLGQRHAKPRSAQGLIRSVDRKPNALKHGKPR